jgi:pimeloyl-ACP methyl ester carboxylesterase
MPKLNRDGVEIYFEIHGEGRPLLLTHGYSATSQMWRGQIEPFSARYKLILWDMRGHGQSDYPIDQAAYSEEHTVADMNALLDAAGAEKAIIGGLSLGGYMSLAFHLARPERVEALLIIDTGPGYRKDEARDGWNRHALRTAERYETEGLSRLAGGSVEMRTSSHLNAEGLARAARGMLTQRDARVIDSLPTIAAPALVVGGAVPHRQRLHGRQDPRRAQAGDPERRPRREHRPAAGVQRRRAGFSGRRGVVEGALPLSPLWGGTDGEAVRVGLSQEEAQAVVARPDPSLDASRPVPPHKGERGGRWRSNLSHEPSRLPQRLSERDRRCGDHVQRARAARQGNSDANRRGGVHKVRSPGAFGAHDQSIARGERNVIERNRRLGGQQHEPAFPAAGSADEIRP